MKDIAGLVAIFVRFYRYPLIEELASEYEEIFELEYNEKLEQNTRYRVNLYEIMNHALEDDRLNEALKKAIEENLNDEYNGIIKTPNDYYFQITVLLASMLEDPKEQYAILKNEYMEILKEYFKRDVIMQLVSLCETLPSIKEIIQDEMIPIYFRKAIELFFFKKNNPTTEEERKSKKYINNGEYKILSIIKYIEEKYPEVMKYQYFNQTEKNYNMLFERKKIRRDKRLSKETGKRIVQEIGKTYQNSKYKIKIWKNESDVEIFKKQYPFLFYNLFER